MYILHILKCFRNNHSFSKFAGFVYNCQKHSNTKLIRIAISLSSESMSSSVNRNSYENRSTLDDKLQKKISFSHRGQK